MIPAHFACWLNINRDCDLRCHWCYARQTGYKERMDMPLVKRSIEFLQGLPVSNVFLIGGEPTIHPDFITIIRLISQAGLKPAVVTNGLSFSDENFLSQCVSAGLTGISTSMKAVNQQQYQQFTGVPAYQRLLQATANIEKHKSKDFFHKLSVTLCKGFFDCVDGLISAIKETGVEMVSFDIERPVLLDNQTCAEGMADPQEMADFIVEIYPQLVNMGIRFNIKLGLPFCLFPESFIDELRANQRIIAGCQIYEGSGIVIDEAGNILPCNHFCQNPLAHIEDFPNSKDYLEWRKSPKILSFYQKISNYKAECCKGCEYWEYCGGGCIIQWLHKSAERLIPNSRRNKHERHAGSQ